nr:MAG TPA: hypothetical protein [Caudoviricetes sp.]
MGSFQRCPALPVLKILSISHINLFSHKDGYHSALWITYGH